MLDGRIGGIDVPGPTAWTEAIFPHDLTMGIHVNTNCYSHDTIGVKRMVHAHAQFAQSWTRGFLARVPGLDGWKVSYSLSRLGRTQLGRSAH